MNNLTIDKSTNLDYLRGISAVTVFISHILQVYWMPILGVKHPISQIIHHASLISVLFFFVLSGYVITLSIFRNWGNNAGKFSILVYAASRFARIYPPFLISICITIIVFLAIKFYSLPGSNMPLSTPNDLYQAREYLNLDLKEVLTALVLKSGLEQINGPLWSLYIEVRMYIIAGLSALILSNKFCSLKQLLGALSLFIVIITTIKDPVAIHFGSWWLLGALTFAYIKNLIPGSITKIIIIILTVTILTTTAETILTSIIDLLIISGIFLSAISHEANSNKRLYSISKYSYTLYVIHFPLTLFTYSIFLELANPKSYSRVLFTLASFFLTMLLSKFLAKYFENTTAIKKAANLYFNKK